MLKFKRNDWFHDKFSKLVVAILFTNALVDNSFGIGYGNQYGKSVPLLPFIDFAACTIKVMTKQQSLYWYIK